MARFYLFFIASRGGQKGHMLPLNPLSPPPPPALRNNEFYRRSVGWLWGGGGIEFAIPPLPLPHPIHIYLCGCGGWRDRQVIQDSAWLALVIIKLAKIIFAA